MEETKFKKLRRKVRVSLERNRVANVFIRFYDSCRVYGFFFTLERIYRKMIGKIGFRGNDLKRLHYSISQSFKEVEEERQKNWANPIKISILVPLYNTPENFLKEMIESVQSQTYPYWELCLADGSTDICVEEIVRAFQEKDNRIVYEKLQKNKGISENTNAALALSTGDYISLLDHDDCLHPSALYKTRLEIDKGADFVYTDEALFKKTIRKSHIGHFKPDFAPDTLRSYNYICHFTTFSRTLQEKIGLFQSEYDGAQDSDMFFRLTEKAKKIVHIPEILYFWRVHSASTAGGVGAKNYAVLAGIKAVEAQLFRLNLKGTVTEQQSCTYRVHYKIVGNPLVSIIIPNKDYTDDLRKCIESIQKFSTWKNYEIIICENNSTEAETFAYYEDLKKQKNIQVVTWKGIFNYSAINNFAVQFSKGEYLLFLNNDIEVITENWLEEMLMFAQREDIGAVGAKLYYPDDTIQHAGVIVGLGGVAGHSHKMYQKQDDGYMSRLIIAQDLSAVTAACLLMKRGTFEEIHGFDESFMVAFNDVDLCMRIRSQNLWIVWTPYAELYHYESKSRGYEDSPEKKKRFNGEVALFKKRWQKELKRGDPFYNPNLTLDAENFEIKRR